MTKNINYFAIALIVLLFTASTGRDIFLLEPVVPSSTVILYEQHWGDNRTERLDIQAIPYLKKGYIVKEVSVTSYNGVTGYMILEKY
jgi:hypothetical protein